MDATFSGIKDSREGKRKGLLAALAGAPGASTESKLNRARRNPGRPGRSMGRGRPSQVVAATVVGVAAAAVAAPARSAGTLAGEVSVGHRLGLDGQGDRVPPCFANSSERFGGQCPVLQAVVPNTIEMCIIKGSLEGTSVLR